MNRPFPTAAYSSQRFRCTKSSNSMSTCLGVSRPGADVWLFLSTMRRLFLRLCIPFHFSISGKDISLFSFWKRISSGFLTEGMHLCFCIASAGLAYGRLSPKVLCMFCVPHSFFLRTRYNGDAVVLCHASFRVASCSHNYSSGPIFKDRAFALWWIFRVPTRSRAILATLTAVTDEGFLWGKGYMIGFQTARGNILQTLAAAFTSLPPPPPRHVFQRSEL
jgi:hypothetical protein